MGVLLTVKGADFSANAIGFAAPVAAGLEYWNYFGDSPAKAVRNLAVGKPAPSQVGALVAASGYHTLQGNVNYLTTGLLDQAEVTLIVAARPAGATTGAYGYLIGNYAGSAVGQGGSDLFFNPSSASPLTPQPTIFASRTASGATSEQTTQASVATPPSLTTWGFYAGRIGAAYNRIDDKTRGLSSAGSVAIPRSTPNGAAYRIGSAAGSVPNPGNGTVDIAFAAIYSRCLSDAELTAIYTRVQNYLAGKNIVV